MHMYTAWQTPSSFFCSAHCQHCPLPHHLNHVPFLTSMSLTFVICHMMNEGPLSLVDQPFWRGALCNPYLLNLTKIPVETECPQRRNLFGFLYACHSHVIRVALILQNFAVPMLANLWHHWLSDNSASDCDTVTSPRTGWWNACVYKSVLYLVTSFLFFTVCYNADYSIVFGCPICVSSVIYCKLFCVFFCAQHCKY